MHIRSNRLALMLLLILSILLIASPNPTQATPEDRWHHQAPLNVAPPEEAFAPGELLVRFEHEASHTGLPSSATQRNSRTNSVMEKYNLSLIQSLLDGDVHLMRVPAGRELEIAAALNAEPGVVYAEPNYVYRAFNLIPNDPHYNKQWAHPRIQSPGAWSITTGSSAIVIAIIDSGVDLTHPDLAGKLVAGRDFVDGDTTPSDLNGHGTHVAGIAAAVTHNSTGVAGMSWGARIMPVRVLDHTGSGYNNAIINGITWAYQNGARIINLSLGGIYYSHAMQEAINNAHAAGSLVIAAMGNCRTTCTIGGQQYSNPIQYPAAYNNVMAVAATNRSDTYAYYSQYGPHCDIAAPGGSMSYLHDPDGIYSTMPTYQVVMNNNGFYRDYDYTQGTSMATPYVSGLAALIWSMDPTLTNNAVKSHIQQTADDLGPAGRDDNYGWGRINAYRAISALAAPDPPALSAIENVDGAPNYTVTWSAVADATGYLLQEANTASFGSATTRYSGPSTATTITGQNIGVWYYRVRANNVHGNNSAWSNVQSVTVLPAAPVLSPIDNPTNADAYVVQWSSVPGAYSYVLVQDADPTFANPITRYAGSATAYTITGQPGGTWYYRAYAASGNLIGPWSASISTTVDPAPLSPPTLSVLSDDGDGDYILDWTDVTNATAYTLEESINPYFTHPLIVYTGAHTIYTVTEQTGGQWHYRVRAAGPLGNSPWSATQTVIVTSYVYLPLTLRDYTPPSTIFEIGRPIYPIAITSPRIFTNLHESSSISLIRGD